MDTEVFTPDRLVAGDKKIVTGDISILARAAAVRGTVLGETRKAFKTAPAPAVSGTGNGTMSAMVVKGLTKIGTYIVKCTAAVTHGGVFSVTDPEGNSLPAFTLTPGAGVASAYDSEQIGFTITDGSTDFAVNDVFNIVVSGASLDAVTTTVSNAGAGKITSLQLKPAAKVGNYTFLCLANGSSGVAEFQVSDPDGEVIDRVVTINGSKAYENEHLKCAITGVSGTEYTAGDTHVIAVSPDAGKAIAVNKNNVDGSGVASLILAEAVAAQTPASGSITVQADGTGKVIFTSAAHGLAVGDIVEITGTVSYNGQGKITAVTTDTFTIVMTWVANDAAGAWVNMVEQKNVPVYKSGQFNKNSLVFGGSDQLADHENEMRDVSIYAVEPVSA